MKASEQLSTQVPETGPAKLKKSEIPRAFLENPNISYLLRRSRQNAPAVINKVTVEQYWKTPPAKIWKQVKLVYQVHRWKGPKKLEFHSKVEAKHNKMELINLPHLKHLDATFDHCVDVKDQGLKIFAVHLRQNLSSLLHLNLRLHNCTNTTLNGLACLGTNIGSHFTHLNRFELGIGRQNFGRRFQALDFEIFGRRLLRYMRNLGSFTIGFYSCASISEKELAILVFQINRYLPRIKNLGIILCDCPSINDDSLEVITQGIVKLRADIQKLSLDFSGSRITSRGLKKIAVMLTHLVSLQEFELYLHYCYTISPKGLRPLEKVIREKLTNLKHLTLSLGSKFEHPTVETFCRLLSPIVNITRVGQARDNPTHRVPVFDFPIEQDIIDQDSKDDEYYLDQSPVRSFS